MSAQWIDHAIWWHVYPLGFTGAPIRDRDEHQEPVPRLDRITAWLDHAVALGANGLQLGPVHASATHGYDTTDHRRLDPRLGDDPAFDRLVAACRERGLRILLDGVFHHVGTAHPLFRRVLDGGDGAELFRVHRDGDDVTWEDFEGHHDLVKLDHDSDAVAEHVAGIMTHWLDRGIDGWRLDAAYAVPPAFWTRVLPRVRERHPDAWFVGEVIHGDYAAIVAESGLDSVTQYELWKAIWSALRDANLYELDHALSRHNGFLDAFTPYTFVGNHDTSRIASVVGDDGAVAALAVLMTTGGIPSIFAGDELAWHGLKEERIGGDDAVRPEFPLSPDALGDSGTWMADAHRALIGLRRRHPWLAHARTTTRELANERLLYDTGDGDHTLTVELITGERTRVRITGEGEDFVHGR